MRFEDSLRTLSCKFEVDWRWRNVDACCCICHAAIASPQKTKQARLSKTAILFPFLTHLQWENVPLCLFQFCACFAENGARDFKASWVPNSSKVVRSSVSRATWVASAGFASNSGTSAPFPLPLLSSFSNEENAEMPLYVKPIPFQKSELDKMLPHNHLH